MIDKTAMHILIVDDEPFMLNLTRRALRNLGYTTVTASCSGARALEAIDNATTAVDLILLDLNMPDMDGVELVRHLVERGFSGSLILVSGEDERILQAAEKLIRAHRIPTLGHLRKPLKPWLLIKLLDKCLPVGKSGHGNPLGLTETEAASKTYSADEVRSAIVNGELIYHYQPKVSLKTGHLTGVETLVRWRHPRDGLVFPDQFVGVAEAHGLVCGLTRKVIAGAFGHAKAWRQAMGMAFQVAINVSMEDLRNLDFADYVTGAADAAGVSAKDVTLEVTESRLMRDPRGPLEVLTRLRLKRFRISIDDFGTGYSSLAQLRDMPFNELKIDRGFVHGAGADATLRAIFDANVMMAKHLGMEIVTEGVEDRADWDHVRRAGCDVAQGYFIGKPMALEALFDWIEDWEGRAPVAA